MPRDTHNRPVKNLRVSVTDRCNFRCSYCMPLAKYEWIERREILTFEEIARLVALFVGLGVESVRLTGGEPLLRRDLERLVEQLSHLDGLKDLSLTTNGAGLAEKIPALSAAGLRRINVSIDTLDPEKFHKLTKSGNLDVVLKGLFAAKRQGLDPIKINAVVERGVNDGEIIDLVEFSRKNGFAIRFIEYMDVGNSNDWQSEKMVSKEEILEIIHARFPIEEIGRDQGNAPSVDYRFKDVRGDLGVIASVTEPFCFGCTRARLTADGKLVTCLFSTGGYDLKKLLRTGAGDEELRQAIRRVWTRRNDRYSEERLAAMQSKEGYHPGKRKKIEMIRLGG